ncbi:RNA polymerase sigma factor [Acidicapsa acidisoli]|uniref:RNA polymerase sigma factor n=1 Tax=Acidicapsa acidisoli TaxID=1615681 RepID=UPI0021DF5F30|nr:sigma-70 family RNA polymerase sigma factor [Acidicapsa acidisoli]
MRSAPEPPRSGELHGKPRLAESAAGLGGSSGLGSGAGSGSPKSGRENAVPAQQSVVNGVPEDMASLAIGNPGMNSARNSGRSFDSGLGLGPDLASGVRAGTVERSDAEIMLAVAAGDEVGYNYLVTKYHRQIIHFLYRMVRNEAVAEELAQEVFLRVYRSRESYRAEAKFSTWLYRIATNLAVNHARDTKNERTAQTLELDAPDAESGSTPEVADDDLNVEQRMLREERMAAIRAQVSALPERQRMAVLMHKYQEMDYRQIGDVLKLSESATKSLLFRAYQTLRERLKEFV